ncbi:hypothetical protein DdX_19258 [Ditylenchus destructor]|uniref:Uncharacterized protein n=1 Tax=Ditylenchus destructor TaxID=166010 RepID=A0AAD4MJQ0_9BILA|nr:hypothetical protein DdX_19258 [Ditylenchus destructor]
MYLPLGKENTIADLIAKLKSSNLWPHNAKEIYINQRKVVKKPEDNAKALKTIGEVGDEYLTIDFAVDDSSNYTFLVEKSFSATDSTAFTDHSITRLDTFEILEKKIKEKNLWPMPKKSREIKMSVYYWTIYEPSKEILGKHQEDGILTIRFREVVGKISEESSEEEESSDEDE